MKDSVKRIKIDKRKNLTYSIYVVPGESKYLPKDLLDENNTTILTEDEEVLVVSRDKGVPVNIQDVVFNEKEEEVKVKDIEFPFDNCNGARDVNQRYFKTESFLHETKYDQEVTAKLRLPIAWLAGIDISTQLKSKYGFYQREMGQETIEYFFKVPKRKNVTYRITWFEIWKSGKAKVMTEEGIIEIPFKVKTRMRYDVSSKNRGC